MKSANTNGDGSTDEAAAWLASIQAGRRDGDWPPVIRLAEDDPDIASAADRLLREIAGFPGDDARLAKVMSEPALVPELRRALAQFGSARLLRIVSVLTDRMDARRSSELLATLRDLATPEGRAIDAALSANARITLRGRLLAEERLDELRHALDCDQETSR